MQGLVRLGDGEAQAEAEVLMLATITRADVLKAIERRPRRQRAWDRFGEGAYKLVLEGGEEVDSKAAVGAAARRVLGRELRPSEFSGGLEHSAGLLVRLGFEVRFNGELLTEAHLPRRVSLRSCSAPLRLYVCRPTGAKAITACRTHNFGTLLSPLSTRVIGKDPRRVKVDDMSGHANPIEGLPFVLDNGVWSCHQAGVEWSDEPMLRLLDRLAHRDFKPEFVVAPDKIAAGDESLEFSLRWLEEKRSGLGDLPWLLAVQDGMSVARVRDVILEQRLAGIFVGGSTPWKWSSLHEWAELGLALGLRVHVGRVNGQRRAQLCSDLGVTSIDGSMISRFSDAKSGMVGVGRVRENPAETAIVLALLVAHVHSRSCSRRSNSTAFSSSTSSVPQQMSIAVCVRNTRRRLVIRCIAAIADHCSRCVMISRAPRWSRPSPRRPA
jgi:hypothetical protein